MPTAPQTPQFVELPVDGAPSKEAFTHHDAAAPDAQIIAHMANAFFGALPHATLPTTGAVTQQSGAPALAGALPSIPAVTPSLTDIPAPSIVTSCRPACACARAFRSHGLSADDNSFRCPDPECPGALGAADLAFVDASSGARRYSAARRFARRRDIIDPRRIGLQRADAPPCAGVLARRD